LRQTSHARCSTWPTRSRPRRTPRQLPTLSHRRHLWELRAQRSILWCANRVCSSFPDRLAALSEMRRALNPGGQLAIATWSRIEDNALYAALYAALRESVPVDLADRLLAPFSGPDVKAFKDTVETAGFHEIHVRSVTLPLIFEGGIAQAA